MDMDTGKRHCKTECVRLLKKCWKALACRQHYAATVPPAAPEVYPNFPPWPPQQILTERVFYMSQIRARTSRIPKGAEEDTPLFSIYRIYERLVLDDTRGYRNEIEYFWWHRNWPVSEIPDPQDSDPARYAFLAGTTNLLVRAFNNNIGLGLARYTPAILSPEKAEELRNTPESEKKYESEPSWTSNVPRIKPMMEIPVMCGPSLIKPTDKELDQAFEKLNIRLAAPHVLFT